MKALIRDFQVIERAELVLGGIVLVAGRNSQGKSSVAKGLAAALTGTVQLGGINKKDGKTLVRAGCSTAVATVQSEAGKATASWPKCEFATDGVPPSISLHAAGLVHVVDMTPRDRAEFLSRTLRTAPDKQDLLQAFADAGLPENVAEKVWSDIEERDWDGKFADVKEKGAKFKGRWEGITGQKFGAQKAQDWLPDGWTDELADADLDTLQAEVSEAEQDLEKAISSQAVGQAEVDRLSAACADIDALGTALTDRGVEALNAGRAFEQAQAERDALPPAAQASGLTCPCCNALLQLAHNAGSNQRLVKAERISDDELTKRRNDIASADGKLSRAKAERDAAIRAAEAATAAHNAAFEAKMQLAAIMAKGKAGTGDDVQQARDALAEAKRRHVALQAKLDADTIRDTLAVNLKVQEILAPDGLRKTKLLKVLDTINNGPLHDLCEAAGWQPVRIEPDLSVTLGGRPYGALSGLGPQLSSDQFRVRAILQVAIAQVQGNALVLIDAADVLDHIGRGGLIQMLRHAGIDAVVCMTYGTPRLAPDLEAAGIGRGYWIEGGVTRSLAEAKAELAAREAA